MYYIQKDGRKWKVREARSLEDALSVIASARASGSVGSKHTLDETRMGGDIIVLADVVQVNSDLTERQPYQAVY